MFNSQSGNANYLKMRQPSLKLMINRTECLNSRSPNLNNLLAVFVEVFLTIIDPNLTIEVAIQQTDRIIGTIWKIMLQNSLYRILLDCGLFVPQPNRMWGEDKHNLTECLLLAKVLVCVTI